MRTRVLVGAVALLLVAIGAVGIYLNVSGGHAVRHVRPPGAPVPSVTVAVLNATSTQGAAAKLARQLRARHVKTGRVGNLTEPLPPGLQILYSPGYSDQAALLARSLNSRHPKVEPINPVAQAAAGRSAHVAVVIG